MKKERIIKKAIVIVQASFDERYLICTHSRAKFSILDTQTDTFVFEEKIRPATSMCFSADDSELYVYDSGKKTVKVFAVGTWECLDLIEIPEFRKADKVNFGDIYTTKNGFCIDFCWKGVMDGENIRWNMLFYDRESGEKRIFEDCAYENYDIATKETIAVWQKNKYAVLSQEKGVEREFYRNVDCDEEIVFSSSKYYLELEDYYDSIKVCFMTKPLDKKEGTVVCKIDLDFYITSHDDFLQKDKFLLRGLDKTNRKPCFTVWDRQGKLLARAQATYAFSAVVANEKLYVADWERLIVVPLGA